MVFGFPAQRFEVPPLGTHSQKKSEVSTQINDCGSKQTSDPVSFKRLRLF